MKNLFKETKNVWGLWKCACAKRRTDKFLCTMIKTDVLFAGAYLGGYRHFFHSFMIDESEKV